MRPSSFGPHGRVVLSDPPIARALFADTRLAWLWIPVRGLVGYHWLAAAWEQLTDPQWMLTGEALRNFWSAATDVSRRGDQSLSGTFYRELLIWLDNGANHVWFAKLLVFAELAVGVTIILGAFVGIAAFVGGFMTMNFALIGTDGLDPVVLVAEALLILAWKTAGYYGLDSRLLPCAHQRSTPSGKGESDAPRDHG